MVNMVKAEAMRGEQLCAILLRQFFLFFAISITPHSFLCLLQVVNSLLGNLISLSFHDGIICVA